MNKIWKTKLAAWLHDPAEKALILLRDKTGHEWGTVARLRDELGIRYEDILKQADWYASAADRPQFPLEADGQRYAAWTQVDFAQKPVLVHPLTGVEIPIEGKLQDISPDQIKSASEDHFRSLIIRSENGKPELRKTLLSFWRFAPETPEKAPELNHLWQNLPADTRVPDHSIWTHLDLVSAFAGATAADASGTPALMAVSFGPVQGFIAEARSTSDLWAGSHLLARIAWEGLKVVCDRFGPDAVLFPNLRGVPIVDVWLRDEMGLPAERFEEQEWMRRESDANPLFAAVLPNRFVALVPSDQVKAIAGEIQRKVREFIADLGNRALNRILKEIGETSDDSLYCVAQLKEQTRDFPEVYWAAVPWSFAGRGGQPDAAPLQQVLGNFYPENAEAGFLTSHAWKLLQKEIRVGGAKFYSPNPGVLYPALYELLDRVAAAAKATRPFTQLPQKGYRSSLNGEREWLTLGRSDLTIPPGRRNNTLWTRLAKEKPSWAKKGEHLDALNAIKRLWPTLFSEEVSGIIKATVSRYIVSTHTLALAVSFDDWLDSPKPVPMDVRNIIESVASEPASLPRQLLNKLGDSRDADLVCRRLPAALDALKESDNAQSLQLLNKVTDGIRELFGKKEEAYFGMILLDGDRMGAWLAGNEDKYQTDYGQSWHPKILESVKERFGADETLRQYLTEKRWPSPARHGSISRALNNFSLRIVPFVIEQCFKGKLVYAGGDDVLAFVCVDDLLPAITMLRCLYSGLPVPEWITNGLEPKTASKFDSKNGYVRLGRSLLLTMGQKAEASCGAVIAHHQAPLGHVLRQLRKAESTAKSFEKNGRNAFSLRILKRAGGEIGLTDKWIRETEYKNAPELVWKLSQMLAAEEVSRRAAYHSINWLAQLPRDGGADMLKMNLAHQFERQGAKRDGADLAYELAEYATRHHRGDAIQWLIDIIMVSEFLARESRFQSNDENKRENAA